MSVLSAFNSNVPIRLYHILCAALANCSSEEHERAQYISCRFTLMFLCCKFCADGGAGAKDQGGSQKTKSHPNGTMNMLTNLMKTHPEVQISSFQLLTWAKLSLRLICDLMLALDKSKQPFQKQKLKRAL